MKTYLATIVIVMASATTSTATPASTCYSVAEASVEVSAEQGYYDEGGFSAIGCSITESVVVCTVAASKGDGAAMDTYRVVLDSTCKKTLRVELIGEE